MTKPAYHVAMHRGPAIGWCLVFAIALCCTYSTRADARARLHFPFPDVVNRVDEQFFEPICNVKLMGRIQKGDYDEIAADLERKFARSGDGPYAICLDSQGGDIREALRIAELFQGWMMVVDKDDRCESACAVLFMTGYPQGRVFYGIAG